MLAGVIPSVVLFATQTVAGARAIDPPVPPKSAASARAGTERSNSRCPDTVHAARIRDYTAPRLVRRHASCQASRGLVTSMPNKDETKTRIGEKYDTLRGPLQRLEGFGRPGGDHSKGTRQARFSFWTKASVACFFSMGGRPVEGAAGLATRFPVASAVASD